MEAVKIESQGLIATSNTIEAGKTGDEELEQPEIDPSGSIFGD